MGANHVLNCCSVTLAWIIKNSGDRQWATVGYEAYKTMTENGAVKRGVLEADNDGTLIQITECSIDKDGEKISCEPLSGAEEFKVEKDALVSMNMLVFDRTLFDLLDEKIVEFFKENKDNLEKCEFLIPDMLDEANKTGFANVKVLHTKATWYGVTYKEDTDFVRSNIKRLVDEGEYPNNLWG